MKITSLSWQGFRAFDEPFTLDLPGGKSLLLHGENGSGKSSLHLALKQFFEEHGGDIAASRNIFSAASRDSKVTIHLKWKDATGTEHDRAFAWNGSGHPLSIPAGPPPHPVSPTERSLLVEAARRSGFLDYRVLLRTNLFAKPLPRHRQDKPYHKHPYGQDSEDIAEQLFDIVTWVLLDGVKVAADGAETTIGELIRAVWEKNPKSRHKNVAAAGQEAIRQFNQAFGGILPDLERRVAQFLQFFEGHELRVTFDWQPLRWNPETFAIENATLLPKIVFRGEELRPEEGRHFHLILNEARLSALALCVFLAGVQLSDTDTNNPDHPRFLVLDDALIGLELQNRIPILKILQSGAFQHYQIFLLTHDRVWFDLARGHLPTANGWVHHELLADESSGQLIPRLKPSKTDLDRAKDHLTNGDLRAAGVYARAAFECRLQNVCQDNGIEISYRKDLKEISVEKLWQGVVTRQKQREEYRQQGHPNAPDFIPATLVQDVELMRSTVLNQLSHSNAPGVVRADVEAAIRTIETLYQHAFPGPR